ncbi:hypothetical protein M0805_006111 [Coniferiporia weirii]|nr:hypothetical protein M0805_006111 [Coniferiporia weirii]
MACSPQSRFSRLLTIASLFFLSLTLAAVVPPTDTSVPPLQWIELTSLLSGSPPPGLKYASIGFDTVSNTLIIFGGESNGFPLQQTYLLNVSSLEWSSPKPPLAQADIKPPARSLAISGDDVAASYRRGFVVIGGKGQDGNPLSDAWEFDYTNQFWSEIDISPGGPSARYSASGGIDPTTLAVSDPTVTGPNNTFYIAGGYDGATIFPLSDVWMFELAGVLAPNVPANGTFGSWTQITFPDELPSRVRQAGTVMPSARVIATGGCSSNSSGDSCAQQDSPILTISSETDISPSGCPAPRVGPVIVPNYNAFSGSFSSQAFMFLGTFNNTLWDDSGGLNQGEVDVLNIENGVWTRLLPSGDPSSGTPKFPVPREGAVAISSSSALVGTNPDIGSDTIVFGGQGADGTYLSDVWLLRSYPASISSSNASWSGFGNGVLETGVDASGAGVTVQYLQTCAKALSSTSGTSTSGPASPTSSSSSSSSSSSPSSSGSPDNSNSLGSLPFDTHVSHKILSPVSVALVLAALVFYRLSLPSATVATDNYQPIFTWLAGFTGLAAYATGIAGMVLGFTTISSTSSGLLERRSTSPSLLKTGHGRAALAFFVALYGLTPFLFCLSLFTQSSDAKQTVAEPTQPDEVVRKNSNETGFTALTTLGREKVISGDRAACSSPDVATHGMPPESPLGESRSRTRSLFGGYLWSSLRTKERPSRPSYDSGGHESTSSAGPSRSFEVLNRGNRARRLSANELSGYSSEGGAHPSVPRSLSDLDWLGRRQNVAAFGELDYALTQLNHTHVSTPAGDSGPLLATPNSDLRPVLPPKSMSILHVLLHALILGLCVLVLVALWQRAPKATFVVFLLWTIGFYCILLLLAWRGAPRASILVVLINSLRDHREVMQVQDSQSRASSRPLSATVGEQYAFPSDSRSPYTFHQPLVRRALSTQEDEYLSSSGHGGHRPDDEEYEDEETQQRRIEQEMDRRDVSIVTVPRRKLWIANPT